MVSNRQEDRGTCRRYQVCSWTFLRECDEAGSASTNGSGKRDGAMDAAWRWSQCVGYCLHHHGTNREFVGGDGVPYIRLVVTPLIICCEILAPRFIINAVFFVV